MNLVEKINRIVEICEAMLETTSKSFYVDGKPVSADEWRNRIKEISTDAKKSKEENEPKKSAWKKLISVLKEEEEEQPKPHWTQYRPSDTNRHFQRKYGSKKNLNPSQQAQDETKQSYNNYLDNIAKQEDSSAVEMYKQAQQEVAKLVQLAKQGKISWKEVNKAQRGAQKLRPGTSSEFTQDRYKKNQNRRYGK